MQDKLLIKTYQTASITPKQSGEYNTLLSQIAKNLALIQEYATTQEYLPDSLNNIITTEPNKLVNHWQKLVTYLYDIVLPEMYVFFHDDSTESKHRLVLHQQTIKLNKISIQWLKNINKNYVDELDFFDNYVIGRGINAEIACEILPVAKLSSVSGSDYLSNIAELFNILIDKKSLKYLLLQEAEDIDDDLQDLLNDRLSNFSIPSTEQLANKSELLLIRNNDLVKRSNPLVCYLLQNKSDISQNTNSISHNKNQLLTRKKGHSFDEKKIRVEKEFNTNQPLMIVLSLLMTFIFSSIPVVILTTLMALLVSYPIIRFIKSKPTIQQAIQQKYSSLIDAFINNYSVIFIGLFVSSIIFEDIFFMLLFAVMTLSFTIYQYYTGKLLLNNIFSDNVFSDNVFPDNVSLETDTLDKNLQKNSDQQLRPQSNNQPINNKTDFKPSSLLPLSINNHAQYLQMLLSISSVQVLEDLIDAVNELHELLDYLQEEHHYLASSVHELIMDITTNSILRLDQVAKSFVSKGSVKPSAKKLFAKQHEKAVNELLHHHIDEVQALSQSILEKQMAGFSQTGTESERQFRDRIMELKILLRWYVAQQPEDFTATSHQVILDSLQNSTLQQMMNAFYDSGSTATQRSQLQKQIDNLLEHFKSNSPMQQANDSKEILQLTHNPNVEFSHLMDPDAINTHMATQEFIEFNEQYVKQLKQHW